MNMDGINGTFKTVSNGRRIAGRVQRFRFIDLAVCLMVEPTTLDHIGKKGRSTSGRV